MVDTIKRHGTWRENLYAYLCDAARKPMRPSVQDCAVFPAGAVEAMTGVDLAADFRGQYKTFDEGKALLRERGFESHIELVAQHFPEIAPLTAQVGDLAVVVGDEGEDALGVVQGGGVYVVQLRGLGNLPLAEAKKAFRV